MDATTFIDNVLEATKESFAEYTGAVGNTAKEYLERYKKDLKEEVLALAKATRRGDQAEVAKHKGNITFLKANIKGELLYRVAQARSRHALEGALSFIADVALRLAPLLTV